MKPAPGTVYLVGAGPGDPELITLRGLRLLRAADVVLHDRLVSRRLLKKARPGAEWIDVGKRRGTRRRSQDQINRLLVEHAAAGRIVVRLKGGDPFVFGRGGEELLACRHAGIPCVIVPGVTSAIAAPAAVGVPVTHRGISRAFAVFTASVSEGSAPLPDPAVLAQLDTIVILMGHDAIERWVQALLAAGKPATTPAVAVERAFTRGQRSVVGTLETIVERIRERSLRAPLITLIGPTAAWAHEIDLPQPPLPPDESPPPGRSSELKNRPIRPSPRS